MKSRKKTAAGLGCVCLLLAFVAVAAEELTPGVPNVFNPNETDFQQQTHFLVAHDSIGKIGENATTATAYYNAIDPTHSKRYFTKWLVNAGFIRDADQWHSTGTQLIACDLPGCDLPSRDGNGDLTYGDNIINTDSHVITLNAADLGFVRNQFIRCKPSCSAPNPIIYAYLENYPVNPFTASGVAGGSGFPTFTGYPTQAEATAALESGLTRPLGDLPGCDPDNTDTALKCRIERIADVAFEWAPPPSKPTSKSRYNQAYAFIINADGTETIALPAASPVVGLTTPDIGTRTLNTINEGDPFPPNLDFLGFKQHPGVCYTCHGGSPKALTSGVYPNEGKADGFSFVPLDINSLVFTSDGGLEATSRESQEPHIKAYNLAVLKTASSTVKFDGLVNRGAHLREVIIGWYAGFAGDQTMSGAIQNHEFIPQGWREPGNGGTAPVGSEQLYTQTVGTMCRSCHFNRSRPMDFGTAASFRKYREGILGTTLKPLCKSSSPEPGKQPMPLAHLTLQRLWQANNSAITLPSGQPPLTLSNTAELLAQYFGYGGTVDYCASKK